VELGVQIQILEVRERAAQTVIDLYEQQLAAVQQRNDRVKQQKASWLGISELLLCCWADVAPLKISFHWLARLLMCSLMSCIVRAIAARSWLTLAWWLRIIIPWSPLIPMPLF
jgi:hypothetical protein